MRLKMMALRLAAVGIGLSLSSGSAAAADPGQDAVVSRDFLAGDLPTPSCHASTRIARSMALLQRSSG